MPNRIHPVRNYKTEVECDRDIDILTLTVLRQILRESKDFLKDKIERKSEQRRLLNKKFKEEYPDLEGNKVTKYYLLITCSLVPSELQEPSATSPVSPVCAAQQVTEGEDSVKKWRVIAGSSLIGCAGKKVTAGETVIELEPPEEGFVMVRTDDGRQGSLPLSCLGERMRITSSM